MSTWKCFQFPTTINVNMRIKKRHTGTAGFKLIHMNATLLDEMFKEKSLFAK